MENHEPKKKKVNDNYDESDNDEDSIRDMLHDKDDIYSSRPGPVSCFDQLSRKYVGSFFEALSKNNSFDVGYRNNIDDVMYCPCSSSMKHWHGIFDLCHIISDLPRTSISFCDSKKFTKSSFQQHL